MAPKLGEHVQWELLGELLAQDLVVLDANRRRDWLAEWQSIVQAELDLDDRIILGIVGGTGVGKSTLINALAREEISASGDRRPTTDRVVVYRHQEMTLPSALPSEDLAVPERVHTNEAVERVVVLDFPDFDSHETAHHEILQRFAPHIDVLVLLVDDVKYADERLFDVVKRLPQDRSNLYFALNKIDELEERYGDRWRDVVEELVADLREKLTRHAGIDLELERFLALSTLEAYRQRVEASESVAREPVEGTGLDDGFAAFEQILEEYRIERRRRAAKELNLDARAGALIDKVGAALWDLDREERVHRARDVLERRRSEFRTVSYTHLKLPTTPYV